MCGSNCDCGHGVGEMWMALWLPTARAAAAVVCAAASRHSQQQEKGRREKVSDLDPDQNNGDQLLVARPEHTA